MTTVNLHESLKAEIAEVQYPYEKFLAEFIRSAIRTEIRLRTHEKLQKQLLSGHNTGMNPTSESLTNLVNFTERKRSVYDYIPGEHHGE